MQTKENEKEKLYMPFLQFSIRSAVSIFYRILLTRNPKKKLMGKVQLFNDVSAVTSLHGVNLDDDIL
jgi:hypothetical protein